MQTKNTDLLFRTDDDLKDDERIRRKATAAAKTGSPVQLTSQVLRVHAVGNIAWTAESGWQARRVDLMVSRRSARLIQHRQAKHSACTEGIRDPLQM